MIDGEIMLETGYKPIFRMMENDDEVYVMLRLVIFDLKRLRVQEAFDASYSLVMRLL
jgi:hypothetical protein